MGRIPERRQRFQLENYCGLDKILTASGLLDGSSNHLPALISAFVTAMAVFGYKPATSDFIDGTTYDAKDPIGYINSFSIGNKDK